MLLQTKTNPQHLSTGSWVYESSLLILRLETLHEFVHIRPSWMPKKLVFSGSSMKLLQNVKSRSRSAGDTAVAYCAMTNNP